MDDKSEMMQCPFSFMASACDRLFEARWHLANAKNKYHEPSGFRYSINAFIRCAKEIPSIISQEMQNRNNYKTDIKPIIDQIYKNPLIIVLKQKRNFIVHQGKLEMHSTGRIGVTEMRIDKLSVQFRVSPYETSDAAYKRYLELCKNDHLFRSLVGPDCDSSPFLERTWKITEFDRDIFDICAEAFRVLAKSLNEIVILTGALGFDLEKMELGSSDDVKRIVYNSTMFHQYMNT